MITMGNVANSAEPNTEVSQSPRNGLRQLHLLTGGMSV
jgi:hypothetical protein